MQRPTICISRQYGARGAAMGRMVPSGSGFRFYSQELIHDIAEQAHVRQQVVESLDERVQDGIAEWVAGLIKRGVFAPTDYLRNLSKRRADAGPPRQGRDHRPRRALPAGPARRRCACGSIAPLEQRVARIAERDEPVRGGRAGQGRCASTASASRSTASTTTPTSPIPSQLRPRRQRRDAGRGRGGRADDPAHSAPVRRDLIEVTAPA